MKRRKAILWLVLAAVIVAGVAAGAHYGLKKGDPAAGTAQGQGDHGRGQAGSSSADCPMHRHPSQSNLDVDIKCRASGQIAKLPFDVSDTVKKGDLLLELDPVDQERQVQQSQASLAGGERPAWLRPRRGWP